MSVETHLSRPVNAGTFNFFVGCESLETKAVLSCFFTGDLAGLVAPVTV